MKTPALCEDMEGILWKWTNYFTGWQPRWFVLETGILSYYKSQDDVNNGCKGSIKMSVCDVIVHPTDNTRLDLIIPGEAHFYVKSATPQERQHWLVALGSCKACLRNGKKEPKTDEISEDGIRAKKSELRLYCDLLMQQVHSVKSAIQEEATPDVHKLNEATSLLSATCDTFIVTLEDCLRLTNASAPYPNPPASPLVTDAALPASPSRRPNQLKPSTSRGGGTQIQRSTSSDRNSLSPNSPKSIVDATGTDMSGARGYPGGAAKSQRSRNSSSRSRTPSDSSELSAAEREHLPQNGRSHSPGIGKTKVALLDEREERDGEGQDKIETIFSTMPASFMDVRLDEDGGIPVLPFLNACHSVLLIFDKLNPTAFTPIKMDISGNIKKIQQKYTTDPEGYRTLQAIVQFEVQHQQATMSQSATVALLWLKRAMQFIREFLAEVQTGKSELEECAQTAYTRTLREYHSLVIRGVFTLAVKSVPYRKDFLLQLANSPSDSENTEYPQVIRKDIDDYITAQDVLVKILDDFYENQGLDYKEMM